MKIKHFTKKLPRRLICVVLHVNILLRHFTHTTYFNEVFVWVKRCGFINVLCARVIRLNQSLFGYWYTVHVINFKTLVIRIKTNNCRLEFMCYQLYVYFIFFQSFPYGSCCWFTVCLCECGYKCLNIINACKCGNGRPAWWALAFLAAHHLYMLLHCSLFGFWDGNKIWLMIDYLK